MSEKLEIYKNFWQMCERNTKLAVIYLNKHSNGLAVPTFLKFTQLPKSGSFMDKKGMVLINIQELLKPRHIESLIKGWPDGHTDPVVSNIWFRLMREANITINELSAIPAISIEATFTPVEFIKEMWDPITDSTICEEVKTGYIVIDFSKNQW